MVESELHLTLWDHLEELRQTLFKAFGIICIGFVGALFFYEPLFQQLIKQIEPASSFVKQVVQREKILNTSRSVLVYKLPPQSYLLAKGSDVEQKGNQYQLKPGSFIEYEHYLPASTPSLVILSPLEGMVMMCKLCLWVSLAATSPLWTYVLLGFILPGLRAREKSLITPFFVCSFMCIAAGISCAYWVTLPLANQYLTAFNAKIGQNLWSLREYVDYTFILFLGHIVAFELCALLLILVHYGFLTSEWLRTKRRWMIVLAFVLGAVLTPPDVPSQLMLALPLIAMYECAILYARMRPHRQLAELVDS